MAEAILPGFDAAPARPDRRTLLVGGAMLAATLPFLLRPMRAEERLGDRTLDMIVPRSFAGWRIVGGDDVVLPDEEQELRVYEGVLSRTYGRADGTTVMFVAVYGRAANRRMTIHRPDGCYPSQGFTITRNRDVPIPLAPGLVVGGREMLADRGERHETVLYWRRLSDETPSDLLAENALYYRRAFAGIVADGALVRMSVVGIPPVRARAVMTGFAQALYAASSPRAREVLVGRGPEPRSTPET